jgi:hypothetical protein
MAFVKKLPSDFWTNIEHQKDVFDQIGKKLSILFKGY